MLDHVDAAAWSVVIGLVGLIVAVTALWLMVRHRRCDRAASISSTVENFVRECEGRRVLWNPFSWEEPALSYQSVQELRQAIRRTRGQLPAHAQGVEELDQMKRAAEASATVTRRWRAIAPDSVAALRLTRSRWRP
jgi:hypothetical protein